LARAEPELLSVLTANALARLRASAADEGWERQVARLILRSKVWSVRKKWETLSGYSAKRSEEVLASFVLPLEVAVQSGLPKREGFTWLDALRELQRSAAGEPPLQLWKRMERHPMVQYVHAQCQSCGRKIPDDSNAPEDPNLKEEPPTEQERPFVRAGWFRGPRGPVVFVYTCPDCGETSRWFRSLHPEVMLNPRRWGRLCGEQEDLKAWLARYLGVHLRVCVPLDWDHVWTEVWDGEGWQPLDPNCVNFARRLHEGIGSWTAVLALGTPGSGGNSPAEATEDATEAYLARAQGTSEELEAWRSQIAAAIADPSGALTQSRTVCGHVLHLAGFGPEGRGAELRRAQADFDAGRDWWDLPKEP